MNEPTHIGIRGGDGRILETLPILRTVTLRGIPGFCIHAYKDEYRVSHLETGAYLSRATTDGEAFVNARRFDKEDIERKIARTREELSRLNQKQKQGA
jgi:hypothetical protein